MAIALLVPATVALADTMYIDTPTGSSANLRSGPSTETDICGELPDGTEVEVLDTDGIWSRIGNESSSAWIMARYLSSEPDANKAETEPQEAESVAELDFSSFKVVDPYYTYIQAALPGAFVNLRWAPSRNAAVAHRINDGGEVIVYSVGDGWSQIMDAESGYISFVQSEYLIAPLASDTEAAD